MANTTELYNEWLEKAVKDPDLKTELENVKGKDEEINDRFYRDLEFGTGGLRGVIGAGTNRMNVYTVGKATQGLANYLKNTGKSDLKVAVAYDSRIKSDVFAKHAAFDICRKRHYSKHLHRAYAHTYAFLGCKSARL